MQHHKYICSKCGERVSSKCVNQRSIFSEGIDNVPGFVMGALSYILSVNIDDKRENVSISMRITGNDADNKIIDDLTGIIAEYPALFRSLLCWHDYRIVNGECEFGCCKAS